MSSLGNPSPRGKSERNRVLRDAFRVHASRIGHDHVALDQRARQQPSKPDGRRVNPSDLPGQREFLRRDAGGDQDLGPRKGLRSFFSRAGIDHLVARKARPKAIDDCGWDAPDRRVVNADGDAQGASRQPRR